MKKNYQQKNITPLKDLNLTSRFLFDEVMEDLQTQQDVLSIILGKDIPLLNQGETEKEFRLSPSIRSIRMDVFSIDENHTVYDTEMQDIFKNDLAKRSRYYQSLLDTSLLEPGIPDYNHLNDSYLILIMTSDLTGLKKYRYTFHPKCEEAPDYTLKDGTTRIFLNTKGTNDDEVPEELVSFLHYVENTTDTAAKNIGSERIMRIHERVCKVKSSEQIGVKYMQAWEEKYYDREEAREEGARDKLKELISKKLQKGIPEESIADMLEESIDTIHELISEIQDENEQANSAN